MAKESSTGEQEQKASDWPAKPDFAQMQKDAAERGERQKEEKDAQRKERQVRLGHVEKPKRSSSKKKEEDSEPKPEE